MVTIEPISRKTALLFKEVRLQALLESPTAFGSTYANELLVSDSEWLDRAEKCSVEAGVGYLAMYGDTACGLVRGTPDDRDGTATWVESMWVAPAHRRQGIGRLLIDEILNWARRRSTSILKLSVTSSNAAAIQFYESLGFVATGITEPYPNDPALVECEMILRLI